MAVRIVSDLGGNWSTPTTWVGGVPASFPDSVAFTATSGSLTVDDNITILGIDFTNYKNVFTIPYGSGDYGLFFLDNGVTPSFVNLGTGGCTFVDNGGNNGFNVASCSVNPIFTGNGISFPFLLDCRFSGYLFINIVGTWLQSGIISQNYLKISGGIFTQSGSFEVFELAYYVEILLKNGSVFNLTTTYDISINVTGEGTGAVNIVAGNIGYAYFSSFNTLNLNCGNIDSFDSDTINLSNITCINITESISCTNTVNLLGTGTLPIPKLVMSPEFSGAGTRTDNFNFGTYTFTEFYYNQWSNLSGDNVNINLLSVLNCDKLYINKPIFMTSKFLGTFGFVCNELIINGGNTNNAVGDITLESGTSYYVNNVVDIRFPTTILASVQGVKAKLILGQNVNQNTIAYLTATDIDSSGGKRVNNFYGSVTNCDNWKVWDENTLPQVSSTF